MDNKEDNEIINKLNRIKKLSKKRKQEKLDKTHEQFNLQLDSDTPETTIKIERNSSQRNKVQKESVDSLNITPTAEESISDIRKLLEKNKIKSEKEKKEKEDERLENKRNKLSKRLRR